MEVTESRAPPSPSPAQDGDKIASLTPGQVKVFSAMVEILSDLLQVSFLLSLMCKYASVTSKHLVTQNLEYLESTFVSVIEGTCTLDAIPGLNCTEFALADERFCSEIDLDAWEVFMGIMFGNAFFLAYFELTPEKTANIVFFPGEATVYPYLLSGILLSVPTLIVEVCGSSRFINIGQKVRDKSRLSLNRLRGGTNTIISPEGSGVDGGNVDNDESNNQSRVAKFLDYLLIAFFTPLWPVAHFTKLAAVNACPPMGCETVSSDNNRGLTPKLLSYTSLLLDLIRTGLIAYVFDAPAVVGISFGLNVVSFGFHCLVMGHGIHDFKRFMIGAFCVLVLQFGFGIYIACFLLYVDYRFDYFSKSSADRAPRSQNCPVYQLFVLGKRQCHNIPTEDCRCCTRAELSSWCKCSNAKGSEATTGPEDGPGRLNL